MHLYSCINRRENVDIKDCKIGTRVVCVNSDGYIPVGAVGIIIEDDSDYPFVSWDEYFNASQYEYDGYKNVYAVTLQEIDVLKENLSEKVASKEANIGKLTVSLATEDVNEIAKDILKVVLQELYEGIETLSKDLGEDAVEKEQVVAEQDVLNNLLHHIVSAAKTNDVDTALKLSEAYQNIKSVQNI